MNNPNDDKIRLLQFLDKIEELAIKMILGIFRFTFIKIPNVIKDFLVDWSEILLKLITTLSLLSLWILIILAPFIYFRFNFDQEGLSTKQILIVVIWGGFGIAGSVWGLLYITKTRLNLLGRIKSLFSRIGN